MCFSMFKEDFVQFPSKMKSDPKLPSGRPSHESGRPLVSRRFKLFKLASVRTSQQHIQTLFRVPEESSIQVHPSGWLGNTVRTPFSVRQVKWFPSQTQIWEDSWNRSDVRSTPFDAIFDKARRGEELQPSGHQSLLWKLRAAKVQPSGRGPIQERISSLLESRLHSCPSGRYQLPSEHCLERIVPDSI
jgi:hypothetical protein